MNIFLAPRSNETSYKNFLSTIENGVDFAVVEPHLSPEGKKLLTPTKKHYAWGSKNAKKSTWEKMERGDLVIFYKGREGQEHEGKFLFAGNVLYKQYSEELGMSLWPPKKGEDPWSCVYFLDDLKPIYIPISEIVEHAGYQSGFIVQGFMPLNDQGINSIVKKYGSIEAFIKNFEIKETPLETTTSDIEDQNEITAHSEAQLLLLKIGKMLGYDTYAPANDRSREAYGEKLSTQCTTEKISTMYIGDVKNIVEQIDVVWFQDGVPIYAFEVEHSTNINSGFTRLVSLYPLSKKLFIVSKVGSFSKYQKFHDSAAFYKYRDKFEFRSYTQLEEFFNSVDEFQKIRDNFLKIP